jgi:hypothetical protein
MRKVLPDKFFRIDFDAILEAAKRQEEIDPTNKGEYAVAQSMHTYFDSKVLPLIVSNDWVFEAASRFASEFAVDCLQYLRLGSSEVYNTQKNLREIKVRVKDFVLRAHETRLLRATGTVNLVKASDFYDVLDHRRLNKTMRDEAATLYKQAQDQEMILLKVTLRSIRDIYETVLPRVIYVVRRAIRVDLGLPHKRSDEKLMSISESIDFYNHHIDSRHPLHPVLGRLYDFYRVARNVGNHHLGLKWEPAKNEVVLQEDPVAPPLRVPLHEFQQRYRYLVYLDEFGVRGILCAFSERERGTTSHNLVREYVKIFPEDFPVDDPEWIVVPYPT